MIEAAQLEEFEENYKPALEVKQLEEDPHHSEIGIHSTNQTQEQTTTDSSDRKMNMTIQGGKHRPTVNCPETNSDQTDETKLKSPASDRKSFSLSTQAD